MRFRDPLIYPKKTIVHHLILRFVLKDWGSGLRLKNSNVTKSSSLVCVSVSVLVCVYVYVNAIRLHVLPFSSKN